MCGAAGNIPPGYKSLNSSKNHSEAATYVKECNLWSSLGADRYAWALVFLSLLLFFPFLGSRDFWAPVGPCRLLLLWLPARLQPLFRFAEDYRP